MESRGAQPEFGGRLDRNDTVTHRGKCCRIAPRSGTDIQGPAGSRWEQMQHGRVNVGKRNVFVSSEEILRLLRDPSVPLTDAIRSQPMRSTAQGVAEDDRRGQQQYGTRLMRSRKRDRNDE